MTNLKQCIFQFMLRILKLINIYFFSWCGVGEQGVLDKYNKVRLCRAVLQLLFCCKNTKLRPLWRKNFTKRQWRRLCWICSVWRWVHCKNDRKAFFACQTHTRTGIDLATVIPYLRWLFVYFSYTNCKRTLFLVSVHELPKNHSLDNKQFSHIL